MCIIVIMYKIYYYCHRIKQYLVMREKVKLRIFYRCIKCVHFGTCVKFLRRCSSFKSRHLLELGSILSFEL